MGSRCEVKNINKVLYFSGRLDESFQHITAVLPTAGELKFNLKDLLSINSSGVREWILMMRKLKAASITLYECPKIFIDQANMVKGVVTENVQIMSFYTPYYNDENGTEKNVLFVFNKHYTLDKLLPLPEVTDENGGVMIMDVIDSKYFRFIKE